MYKSGDRNNKVCEGFEYSPACPTRAHCPCTCMYLYILPSSGALNRARCNHGNNALHRLSSLKYKLPVPTTTRQGGLTAVH